MLWMPGCASSGSPALGTFSSVQVLLTQEPPSPLEIATVAPIIATVLNDSKNMGVDWQVSCTIPKCGTFSPTHTASGDVTMYVAFSQTSGIRSSTFQGNYAALLDLAVASGEEDIEAEVTSDGTSALNGTADIATFGTTTSLAPTTMTTGSFTSNSNGRFTGSLGLSTTPAATLNQIFYVVNSSTELSVDTDATSPGTGQLQLQQFVGGPTISIAFTPGEAPPAILQPSQTATMAATVTNDTGQGVNWTVSCGGSSCTL